MIHKLVPGLERTIDICCGVMLSVAIVLNFSNVIGRYVFHEPIFWAEEVMTILIAWTVCLACFRLTVHGEHLKMDILRTLLPAPALRVLEIVLTAGTGVLAAVIAYYAWEVVELVSRMEQVTTVAEIPKSVANSSILVGFALIALGCVIRVLRVIRGAEVPAASPIVD